MPLLLRRPPPFLRQTSQCSPLRSPRIRQFHASLRRSRMGDPLPSFPHEALVYLHNTGLPWAVVIPIAAVGIRVAMLALFVAPARLERAKINEITPLISAKAVHAREEMEKTILDNPRLLANKSARVLYKEKLQTISAQLFAKYGVSKHKTMLPILQLPVFLIMAETLRRMMGLRSSVFSGTSAPVDVDSDLLGSATADANAVSEPANWFEPTMMLEGPFAITDLTAADPTLILPLAVSGFMLANLRYGQHRNAQQGLTRSKFSRILHNTLMGAAVLIFPLTLHLPAGFLYYWACTSASSLASDMILDKLHPPRLTVKACRRPLPSIPKTRPTAAS
ncbi:hypothetical protein FKW77_002077 [Venturia effusa]|uniref:Membrane insertase YidC/Oxa/ALB C-terminal domain-containing protein n=1 Tax=Venturia effusa TaxID=50376 RepID=A0A517LKZ3_9PEZI|nr:hypothetical protein FKW77_002077 [Venturia effusa]